MKKLRTALFGVITQQLVVISFGFLNPEDRNNGWINIGFEPLQS